MTPIEQLMHEHEVILMVIDAVERDVAAMRHEHSIHPERIRRMLDFFRNFADHCHHAKEENHLFKLMTERGFPAEMGPIAVMLSEHNHSRQLLRNVEAALSDAAEGNADAIETVAENLGTYAELLRAHIGKEDHILYPMANRAFTDDDQAHLQQAFEKVEREEIGEGTHEKYHQLAHELAGK